mmetsp:Transcript_40902/g.39474  ORF Transcript_40902/g.39474 Transcript_40902/m.39474 type:complete len:84 (+) Transcript_40902:642-893(+)
MQISQYNLDNYKKRSQKKNSDAPNSSACGVQTIKPNGTMFEIIKHDYLKQHMEERIKKRERMEYIYKTKPVKGIHTRASELRS